MCPVLIKIGGKMNNYVWAFVLLSVLLVSGCAITNGAAEKEKTPVAAPALIAKYTETPVVIDGTLDDPIWSVAPVYQLSLSKDLTDKGEVLKEEGCVQLAWDEKYLYVAIKFVDSDIVQESDKDQDFHFLTGDLVEVFLKPTESTWYWEIYGTPNEKKSVFFFPGRGRLGLQGCYKLGMDLDTMLVGAKVKGTLNDWKDKDEYWTLEMAIPAEELTRHGNKFGVDSVWTILIGRYNYSRYFANNELSMAPQLSVTSYHMYEEYAKLVFEK